MLWFLTWARMSFAVQPQAAKHLGSALATPDMGYSAMGQGEQQYSQALTAKLIPLHTD